MEKRIVYADNSATTNISDEVFEAMLPYLKDQYGNASSIYKLGRDAQKAIEESRAKVAKALNADPKEIFFTSCGTESDNWAIRGVCEKLKAKGKNRYGKNHGKGDLPRHAFSKNKINANR